MRLPNLVPNVARGRPGGQDRRSRLAGLQPSINIRCTNSSDVPCIGLNSLRSGTQYMQATCCPPGDCVHKDGHAVGACQIT